MGEFRDQVFNDQVVVVDGNKYVGCTFNRCVMSFRGEDIPILQECKLVDSKWRFDEHALHTIHFLAELYRAFGDGGRDVVEATFENIRRGHMPKIPDN